MKYLGLLVIDDHVNREVDRSPAMSMQSSGTCWPCVIGGSVALAVMVGVAASMIWWIARLWFG